MALPTPSAPDSLAVLLVEDDPTNQLIALSMLRHLGIEADAASDGRAGVRCATERDYDVVLMDIQMPVMDGIEAMKAIRALLPPERCPRIVAVTAHAVTGTRERLLAVGFDGFFNKPISLGLLQEALTEAAVLAVPAYVVRAQGPGYASQERQATDTLLDAVRAHVRRMLGEDDEDFVVDLVSAFAESSHQAVEEAEEARATRDADAVARVAHRLKGSASNIGLDQLTERWDHIETEVRSGTSDVFARTLADALDETTRTVALLETAL